MFRILSKKVIKEWFFISVLKTVFIVFSKTVFGLSHLLLKTVLRLMT